MHRPQQTAGPSDYTDEYFLHHCDGYEAFASSNGEELTSRLAAIWRFAVVASDMRLLDIGCGRGEIVTYAGLRCVRSIGLDYADAGLRIAQAAIGKVFPGQVADAVAPELLLADATQVPLLSATFDRIVMSDIVEHLLPADLGRALGEARRVLKPGGTLLVHTMPNIWYYRLGYPLYRIVRRTQGVRLPANPRERFAYSHVHVNEQSPTTLRRALVRAGFSQVRVWLYDYRSYDQYGARMRTVIKYLTGSRITRAVFCDDIFAVATR
jgi:ubiquinone/menaquinone biosynthesis C-methylase UbiE